MDTIDKTPIIESEWFKQNIDAFRQAASDMQTNAEKFLNVFAPILRDAVRAASQAWSALVQGWMMGMAQVLSIGGNTQRKRASRSWRKHMRRVKAQKRRVI